MDKKGLYNIAVQCARLSSNGCSQGCEQCQFNVFNYGLPINEASLLKANAYTDYFQTQQQEIQNRKDVFDSITLPNLIATIIIIGLIAWGCSSVKTCVSPKQPATKVIETSYEVINASSMENDTVIYTKFLIGS